MNERNKTIPVRDVKVKCERPCLKQPDGSDTLFKNVIFRINSGKTIECKQCKKQFDIQP